MKLFLYCKEKDAERILQVKYLRLSIPNKMNDPFELLGQTELEVKRPDFDREMKESKLRRIFYRDLKRVGYPKSYAKFQKELEKNPDFFFDIYKTDVPLTYKVHIERFLDDLSEHFGFLCLSRTNSSILMWSHYSEKHKGIVLGFETTKMNIEQKHLATVEYDSNRIKIVPTIDPDHKRNEKEWEKLIRRKHLDWKYEEEVRMYSDRYRLTRASSER